MDKVIETLEELTQITATMPETRFQMALVRAISELNRCRQLEGESAAMRQALEQAPELYDCAWSAGNYANRGLYEQEQKYANEAREVLAAMQQALAPDAGKDLLEKVQRLEGALQTVVKAYIVPEPQRQTALYLAMNEVYAALEGGAE